MKRYKYRIRGVDINLIEQEYSNFLVIALIHYLAFVISGFSEVRIMRNHDGN